MTLNSKAWSHPNAVNHYANYRHSPSETYASERVFLPKTLYPDIKVLDIGCASGGFYQIMRSWQPKIDYTGVDISEPSIRNARVSYPKAKFLVASGVNLPFDDGDFNLVHCTGVCVHEPQFLKLISDAYRVTNRYVIVDLRLQKGADGTADLEKSYLRVEFEGQWDGTKTYYIVADPDAVLSHVLNMNPRPKAVQLYGYLHKVSPMARSEYEEVCMAVFFIEKGDQNSSVTTLDLTNFPLQVEAKV